MYTAFGCMFAEFLNHRSGREGVEVLSVRATDSSLHMGLQERRFPQLQTRNLKRCDVSNENNFYKFLTYRLVFRFGFDRKSATEVFSLPKIYPDSVHSFMFCAHLNRRLMSVLGVHRPAVK